MIQLTCSDGRWLDMWPSACDMLSIKLYPVLFSQQLQECSFSHVEYSNKQYLMILVKLQMKILRIAGITSFKFKDDFVLSLDSLNKESIKRFDYTLPETINNFYMGYCKESYWDVSFLDLSVIETNVRSIYEACSEIVLSNMVDDYDESILDFECDFMSGEFAFMFAIINGKTDLEIIEWPENSSYGDILNKYVDKGFVYKKLLEIRSVFDEFFGKNAFLDLREELLYDAMRNSYDIWNPEFEMEVMKCKNNGIELWKDYILSHSVEKDELEKRVEHLFSMYDNCIIRSYLVSVDNDICWNDMTLYYQLYLKEVDDVLDALKNKYSDFSPAKVTSSNMIKNILEVNYV